MNLLITCKQDDVKCETTTKWRRFGVLKRKKGRGGGAQSHIARFTWTPCSFPLSKMEMKPWDDRAEHNALETIRINAQVHGSSAQKIKSQERRRGRVFTAIGQFPVGEVGVGRGLEKKCADCGDSKHWPRLHSCAILSRSLSTFCLFRSKFYKCK